MHAQFKAISLSYKSAPLHVRELTALQEDACKLLLETLKDVIDASEILILSTCNRTEVYYSSNKDYSTEIIKLIGIQKGISDISSFSQHFQVINDHNEAVHHLFNVSMGLESQVVGDMQIINQVKNAYQWSADAGLAGPFMHRLLHTIFFANKKVVQETSFRDGAASVSYAAVELVEELTADMPEPKVLVLGLGEIGADVCKNLADSKMKNITICNRTRSKAEALAEQSGKGITVVGFENVYEAVAEADVIISSVAMDTPFITKELVNRNPIYSYKFFVDLSVPRSVDPAVEEIHGALVYNIDNINARASEALQKRINAIPHVRQIVAEAIAEFGDWSKEMLVSPTINKFKNALEQIRQEEITRYMKQLNEEESKKVELITKNIMQKVLKLPVLQLKAACKRGEAETLIDVLNDLFNLEQVSEINKQA
jgi:glutamyl-tRNA reductase